MQKYLTIANVSWLITYLAMVGAVVFGMLSARSWATDSLADPTAAAQWQKFRDDARAMSEDGPVLRRVPPSSEPPTLRLLRDHFPASLGAALFFSSAMFLVLMVLVRGAFQGSSNEQSERKFADVDALSRSARQQ